MCWISKDDRPGYGLGQRSLFVVPYLESGAPYWLTQRTELPSSNFRDGASFPFTLQQLHYSALFLPQSLLFCLAPQPIGSLFNLLPGSSLQLARQIATPAPQGARSTSGTVRRRLLLLSAREFSCQPKG